MVYAVGEETVRHTKMLEVITKEQAVAIYGSQAELARALGIERSAVCQWRDGVAIPEKQALKIRYVLKPELFSKRRNA